MEWHIPPVARRSYFSGQEFEKDDRLASALVRTAEGEIIRVDARLAELKGEEMPGETICRWTQVFKPKPDDGREEAEAMKLTADNLFISLFEGEDRSQLSEENAELKHFLALMLERRRVLRAKTRTRRFTRYIHRPSKEEFLVPAVELEPSFFLENEEKLSFLIDGGEGGAAEHEGEGSSESGKAAED